MPVFFKVFDSKMASREKLFKAAVEFANKIDRERLINITHSEDRDNIVITIWYWAEQEEKDERQVRKPGEFKAPPSGRTTGAPVEPASSKRILEQSGTARASEPAGTARPPEAPVAVPPQEAARPVPPPRPKTPPEKIVDDSWS